MTPDDELAAKRARVAALLDSEKLDGLLLAAPASVSWMTCGGDPVVDLAAPVGVAAVLCTREGEALLTTTIEHARLLDEALPRPPAQVDVAPWYEGSIVEQARRLVADGRLGADLALDGFYDYSEQARMLRLILTPTEQERYRALGRDAALAIEETAATIEPGMTEREIAGALAAETYDRGAAAIVTLVAADGRVARYRHPAPTANVLERYALLVLCARRHGLVASVTRAVHFGPIPEDLLLRQESCAQVDAAFLAATKPGRTAGDVLAAGMAAYAREGYPEEWRLHHQGGATGYVSREWLATPHGAQTISEGMAFAWNPSITGTKSEDTALLTITGLDILTATDEWPVVDVVDGGALYRRPGILQR